MTADHTAVADALAQAGEQPAATFDALARLADALAGARMFTVLAFDFPRNVAVRLYSTDDATYPSGLEDPIGDTIWERTLIANRQPLVLNNPEAMATLLPNVPELVDLGCEAMLNLPVVVAGQTIAALNMLHQTGRYTPDRVEAAKALAPAAAAILLWAKHKD